jgi:hypothetical protein
MRSIPKRAAKLIPRPARILPPPLRTYRNPTPYNPVAICAVPTPQPVEAWTEGAVVAFVLFVFWLNTNPQELGL